MKDSEIVADILKEISLYFSTNVGSVDDPISVWSSHKCYIREILLKDGHAAKQRRNKTLSDLLAQLYSLERQHKSRPDRIIEAELVRLREGIRDHSLYKVKHLLLKGRRSFYEYGDKCGPLLANALRTKRS